MNNEQGFTLIESITSLVLVGILVTVAGMAIVRGMDGYVFARENTVLSQKSRLVMARIGREIRELSEIDANNSDDSCIRYKVETVSPFFRAIGLNNENLRLNVSSAADCDCPSTGGPGDLLADRVGSFTIGYEDQDGATASTPPANLSDLRAVKVNFTLNRADNHPNNAFGITINPRNNRL